MDRKLEEPSRRQIRALAQRAELLPHHLLGDVGHAGGGFKVVMGTRIGPKPVGHAPTYSSNSRTYAS